MIFTPIDRENWSRKEYFDHYFKEVPCTYSITTKLDITGIKQQGFRLYPTLLYLIAKTVNRFDSFRTAFRADGSLVVYEEMSPCYTIFHKETETFSNIWTEYTASYAEFCRRYARDLERFGSVEKMTAKPGQPALRFRCCRGVRLRDLTWISPAMSTSSTSLPLANIRRQTEDISFHWQYRCIMPYAMGFMYAALSMRYKHRLTAGSRTAEPSAVRAASKRIAGKNYSSIGARSSIRLRTSAAFFCSSGGTGPSCVHFK